MALVYEPLTFPVGIPALVELFDAVERDAHRLIADVDEKTFARNPAPGEWSAAQCLDHLIVTIRVYVPAMEQGLQNARSTSMRPAQLKPGMLSRWFIRQIEPPVKRRFKSPPKALPAASTTKPDEMWAGFVSANDLFRGFARRCEHVDVNRVRYANPFAPLRFTLAAGFAAMVGHHRRHVCQMERALEQARA